MTLRLMTRNLDLILRVIESIEGFLVCLFSIWISWDQFCILGR